MTTTLYRFLLPLGLALTLSSCDVFRPDADPAANNTQNYGAAGAYDTNNNAGGYAPYQQQPQGGNTYGGASGAYGAGNNNAGAYSQPNYSTPSYNTPNYTPYTQPADTTPYSTGGSTGGGRTHTVAGGENLSKIAQRYGTTTDAIMRANNITNPNYVRAGQKLTIP